MNAYDFDNTIYDGESPFDFFLFCIKKKKRLIIYLPVALLLASLYKLRLLSIKLLLKLVGRLTKAFNKNKGDLLKLVDEFWELNEKKLKPNYLAKLTENDIIITAAPRFLMDGIKHKLNVRDIMSSEFNVDTGKFEFANFRENKVKAFKEKYPNERIINFYTDSYNDAPLMEIAENFFLVKGNKDPILIKSKEK